MQELIHEWPLQDVDLVYRAVDFDGHDEVRIADRFEGGVDEGLVQINDQAHLMRRIRGFGGREQALALQFGSHEIVILIDAGRVDGDRPLVPSAFGSETAEQAVHRVHERLVTTFARLVTRCGCRTGGDVVVDGRRRSITTASRVKGCRRCHSSSVRRLGRVIGRTLHLCDD